MASPVVVRKKSQSSLLDIVEEPMASEAESFLEGVLKQEINPRQKIIDDLHKIAVADKATIEHLKLYLTTTTDIDKYAADIELCEIVFAVDETAPRAPQQRPQWTKRTRMTKVEKQDLRDRVLLAVPDNPNASASNAHIRDKVGATQAQVAAILRELKDEAKVKMLGERINATYHRI